MNTLELLNRLASATHSSQALECATSLYESVKSMQREGRPLELTEPQLSNQILDQLKSLPMSVCNAEVVSQLYRIEGLIIDLHSLYREDQADSHYILGRVRRQRLLEMVAALPEKNRKRILDAGCGDGTYFHPLRKFAHEVVGVDVSPERLDRIREKVPEARLHALDLNRDRLPIQTGELTSVLATEVLEHVLSIDHLLSEFSRCLTEDGVLIASFPNRGCVARKLEAYRAGRPTSHSTWFHPNDWNYDDFKTLLKKHGFEVEKVYGIGFRLPKAVGWLKNYRLQEVFSRISVLAKPSEELMILARKTPHA